MIILKEIKVELSNNICREVGLIVFNEEKGKRYGVFYHDYNYEIEKDNFLQNCGYFDNYKEAMKVFNNYAVGRILYD